MAFRNVTATNADDLARRAIERRAVEVAIWGMPAVSMAAVRASLKRDLNADFADVIYLSNVMEPRHEFLTANNQTPYVVTCFDLREGPMVLEVPPRDRQGKDFWLVARFYGPEQPLFDKSWIMPDVEKIQ